MFVNLNVVGIVFFGFISFVKCCKWVFGILIMLMFGLIVVKG